MHGEVKSPPFSLETRRHAGFLLRLLQKGEKLSLPQSRPMSVIGGNCHELRIPDRQKGVNWRIIYRIDADAIIIAEVFPKKTQKTPASAIDASQRRLNLYDKAQE